MSSILCFSRCTAKHPPKSALNDSEQEDNDRTLPVSDMGEGSDITVVDIISKNGQNIFTKLWELLCRGPKLWKPPHEDHASEKLSYTHAEGPTWSRIRLSQAAHDKVLGHGGTRTGKAKDTDTGLQTQRSGMYLDWYYLRAKQSKLYPKSSPFRRQPDIKPVCSPSSATCSRESVLPRKGCRAKAQHLAAARNLRLSQSLACVDTEICQHLSYYQKQNLRAIDVQSHTSCLDGGVDLNASRKIEPQATDMNSINAKGEAHESMKVF